MSHKKLGGRFYNYFKQTRKQPEDQLDKKSVTPEKQHSQVFRENIIDGPKEDKVKKHKATFVNYNRHANEEHTPEPKIDDSKD